MSIGSCIYVLSECMCCIFTTKIFLLSKDTNNNCSKGLFRIQELSRMIVLVNVMY